MNIKDNVKQGVWHRVTPNKWLLFLLLKQIHQRVSRELRDLLRQSLLLPPFNKGGNGDSERPKRIRKAIRPWPHPLKE